MNKVAMQEVSEIIHAVHYRPAVSIIMPFETKMSLKTELLHSLNVASDKVENELHQNYPGDIAFLVMHKIKKIIAGLNFNTFKNSIAIFVSPVFEKVLYLDIPVEEKIIIDESFEIRDLVYSKKQSHRYLAMLLSNKECLIYLGNTHSLVRIVSNTPEINTANKPQRVANFSDIQDLKQTMLDKFLKQVDNSLDILLKVYNLPIFVMGTDKTIGHFKSLTKHSGAIIDYIHGNYEDVPHESIKQIIDERAGNWQKIKQKYLLNQLEEAQGKMKLAIGIRDVWREATNKKGRLLVVEKKYRYTAQQGSSEEIIYQAVEPYNKFSYIKDAVDDVMEKVLENGGDIEFVEEGVLKEYHHIALLQYY